MINGMILDDFDFDIVNFPFLDGDVLRRPSYSVYISTYSLCHSIFACYLLTSIIVPNS